MDLHTWAQRWGVSTEAVANLQQQLLADSPPEHRPPTLPGDSEAAVQNRVRVAASKKGVRLWRNNVGAMYTEDGRFVRFGLANETAALNKMLASSDLIGLRPVIIGPHHMGVTIGQFVAREVKASGWKFRGTVRETAQKNFLELVLSLGGDAAFVKNEGEI